MVVKLKDLIAAALASIELRDRAALGLDEAGEEVDLSPDELNRLMDDIAEATRPAEPRD